MKRMEPENQHGNWMTPREPYLSLVREVGNIYLDPCAAQNPKWHFAEVNFNGSTAVTDGLRSSWDTDGRGLVFVNCPYGHVLLPWAKKIAVEAAAGVEIVALLPARTDPDWMQGNLAPRYDAMCFLKKRIAFLDPATGKPALDKKTGKPVNGQFPSVLVYFGDRAKRFVRVFHPHGWIITR